MSRFLPLLFDAVAVVILAVIVVASVSGVDVPVVPALGSAFVSVILGRVIARSRSRHRRLINAMASYCDRQELMQKPGRPQSEVASSGGYRLTSVS